MIASIGNSYSATTADRSSANRSKTAFADFMASTAGTSTSASSSEQISISGTAVRAADITQTQYALGKFDINYSNVDHSQTDYANHFAEGAKLVSASQGLPEGQYDFTRMSDRQLQIVTRDMVLNHEADIDQVGALTIFMSPNETGAAGTQTEFSDVPVNRFAQIKASADYCSQHGYTAAARIKNDTLSMMTAMHEAANISISYDDNPQSITSNSVADASTKLNEALAAFKKEASLTPAQRARRDVLKTMNLTEDNIKAMPPEQQKATEQKIATEVARRLRLGESSKVQAASTNTGVSDPVTPTL